MARHPTTYTGLKRRLFTLVPIVVLLGWFGYMWFVSRVVPSVEKYPGGAIRAEGYAQRAGFSAYQRTGHWVTYHAPSDPKKPGVKESEGMYRDGAKDGEWRYWDDIGAEVRVETYKGGQLVLTRPSH